MTSFCRTSSSVIICAACSKWRGSGNSATSSPATSAFGHHSSVVFTASASSRAQHSLISASFGFPTPPACSNVVRRSGSGASPMRPSATSPASLAARFPLAAR